MFEPSHSQPIGLFDSGVGGLTVLREMYRQLPQESLIYFGDTAHLPYGGKSGEEIITLVRHILDWMAQQRVKMVIMACNTSSALALEQVRQEYDFPILGLILPGARAAVKTGQRIGVIATEATARSNAYKQAIAEIDPQAQVWQQGCPEFVPLIESQRLHDDHSYQVARRYLEPLLHEKIQTLIYGCSHYRHLEKVIRDIVGPQVSLIDPAESVVMAADQELELMGLKHHYTPRPTRFAVSGSPQQFAQMAQFWLGYQPQVEKVKFTAPTPKNSEPTLPKIWES